MTAEQLALIEYWYSAYRTSPTGELRRIAKDNMNAYLNANMTDVLKALRASLQPLT